MPVREVTIEVRTTTAYNRGMARATREQGYTSSRPRGYRTVNTYGEGRMRSREIRSRNGYTRFEVVDPYTGRKVFSKAYRGEEARRIRESIRNSLEVTPKDFRQERGSNIVRNALGTVNDPVADMMKVMNHGRGMLKAGLNQLKSHPDEMVGESGQRLDDFLEELRRAISRGDVEQVRLLTEYFDNWHTNEELEQYYEYHVTDADDWSVTGE